MEVVNNEPKTVKSIADEAAAELREERMVEAKKKIKVKLKELEASKRVTKNLERELEELYVEIGESLS